MNIGLVQINNRFAGGSYFPYSAGLMQSYAQKHYTGKEILNFQDIFYKRTTVQELVSKLYFLDVVAFSIYIWSAKISLKIASEIKKINPSCVIIFGGPQVPDDAFEFLNKNKFIDIAVHGEGEKSFTEILNRYNTRDFSNIESTSYVKKDGTFVQNPSMNRIQSLDTIPSPYLSGVFDNLIKNNPDEKWSAIWETNRGCPFSCAFCDWGSSKESKIYQFNLDRIRQEIDWFVKNKIEFIYGCDANFGILKRDIDIVNYIAKVKKETGYPHALALQNTKNATDRAYTVQKVLSDAGLNRGVALAMQSMDKTTLKNVKRTNISLDFFRELQRRFTKDKIETYSDIIVGLPGETYDSFVNGIDEVICGGQHNKITFGKLLLLPHAVMGKSEYQNHYGIKYIESKMINAHSSLSDVETDESIQEMQHLVTSTNSMPREYWVKSHAYSSMVSLLYFSKLLQIPITVMHLSTGIKHRRIFEFFMNINDKINFPVISEISEYFINKSTNTQEGGEEYSPSKEWLNIWWLPDEYILIKLVKENKIEKFYNECESLMNMILSKEYNFSPKLLHQCIKLNFALLKIPFETKTLEISASYNIYEYYKNFLHGEPTELIESKFQYIIDRSNLNDIITWDDWYKNVVWYGNKKAAFLYENVEAKIL